MVESREHYQKILNGINKALFLSDNRGFSSTIKRDAGLLANRGSINAHSINQLINGTQFSLDESKNITIPDVSSMMSLLRTQIEAYASFNHIFCANSEEEIEIYYNLWCISGLSKRVHIEINNDLHNQEELNKILDKKNREENEIEHLKSNILNSNYIKDLPNYTVQKIKKHLNSNWPSWEVQIIDEQFKKLTIKDVILNTGVKEKIFENVYNLLSWYAHPNYLSIIQLKDMYSTKAYKDFTRIIMNQSGIFMALLIYDYFNYFNDRKEIIDKIPSDVLSFIELTNSLIRNI